MAQINDADFTPSLGNQITLSPFRFWCQKVLPLVYDDSLSYYELLCKVVDYLNKTMQDVNTLAGDVENLHKAYVQLQDYVNNYFNSLDVQEEINNKLDELVNNGTMSSLIAPIIAQYTVPIFVGSVSEMTDKNRVYVLSTNQHIYTWNEQQNSFTDTLAVYNFPADTDFTFNGSITSSTDINTLQKGGFYYINSSGNTNAPTTGTMKGWIICWYSTTVPTTLMQMFLSTESHLYSRQFNSSWNRIDTLNISFTFNGTVTQPTNIDTLQTSGFYYINSSGNTNAPTSSTMKGWIICFYSKITPTTLMQLYLSTDGLLYSHVYGSNWIRLDAQNSLVYHGVLLGNINILEQDDGYYFINSSNALNAPYTGTVTGWLCVYKKPNAIDYYVFYSQNGNIYWKITSKSNWNLIQPSTKGFNFLGHTTAGEILNCNSILDPGYYFIHKDSVLVPDLNRSNSNGWLINLYINDTATPNVLLQLFFSVDGKPSFSRKYNDVWMKLDNYPQLKIATFGDSIMGSYTPSIASYLADCSGNICYETAFGGTRLVARNLSNGVGYFDFSELLKAVISGNYTNQIANKTSNPAQDFTDNLNTLMSIDFSNIDIVTIAYGTNDYTAGTDLDQFKAEIKNAIDTLTQNFPNLRIIFITPTWRYFTDLDKTGEENVINGHTIIDFVNAVIDVAKTNNCPVIDSYHNILLNKFNYSYWAPDGLHLNERGRKLYAHLINKYI